MKKVIYALILTMMTLSTALAEDKCSEQLGQEEITGKLEINTDVPNHLKGATIIVRLANGKESSVSAEKFKVVPRKQQFLTTATKQTKVVSCQSPSQINKNRVSLLGGYGAQRGLDSNTNSAPNLVEVESKVGLVGGLQYQRLISDRVSVGGQLQTNKTPSLMIGLDF